MSSPAVVITNFTNATWQSFLRSDRAHLSHEKQVLRAAGTIALLVNLDEGAFVGACVLQNWSGSDCICRKSSPSDKKVHQGKNVKYNNYHIRIGDLRLFKNQVSYASILSILAPADSRGNTNMWRSNQISFAAPFCTRTLHTTTQNPDGSLSVNKENISDRAAAQRFSTWAYHQL